MKIENNEPKFYNKNGDLTRYGFACGYIMREESKTIWKEIYKEHTVFHVRSGPINGKFEVWETFEPDQLTKARKLYNSIKV